MVPKRESCRFSEVLLKELYLFISAHYTITVPYDSLTATSLPTTIPDSVPDAVPAVANVAPPTITAENDHIATSTTTINTPIETHANITPPSPNSAALVKVNSEIPVSSNDIVTPRPSENLPAKIQEAVILTPTATVDDTKIVGNAIVNDEPIPKVTPV